MLNKRVLSFRLPMFMVILAAVGVIGFYLGLRFSGSGRPQTIITSLQAQAASTANGGAESSAPAPGSSLAAVFTPEVQHWAPLIKAWGQAYNVDPNLIATVIQIESCGDPTAVSGAGAQGLFQVMPFHFSPGEDMQDVTTNGRRGMEYLAKGLQVSGGDPGLALAGYNGGLGVISGGWARWSAETRRYYQWGVGIYKDALNQQPSSPTLQSWLDAGGQHLCQRAQAKQSTALN